MSGAHRNLSVPHSLGCLTAGPMYLPPLSLSVVVLEKTLVVRNSILAVDEARTDTVSVTAAARKNVQLFQDALGRLESTRKLF